MTQRSRTVLKTYFNTGDAPSEANFSDLIDSSANLIDDVIGDNDFVEAVNLAAFPGTGVANTLYLDKSTGKLYTWETSAYVERSTVGTITYQEFTNAAAFPGTGIIGIQYADKATGLLFRWSGSAYVQLAQSTGATYATPLSLSANYSLPDLTTQEKAINGFEKVYKIAANGYTISLPGGVINDQLFVPDPAQTNIISIISLYGVSYLRGILQATSDTTGPTFTFSISNSTPNIIDITPSESVNVTTSGWSLVGSEGAVSISSVTGGSGTTPKFVLSRNAVAGETFTISYDPSTGNTTDQASVPNEASAISGVTVTNGVSTYAFLDDFSGGNTSDILGRVTPVGGKTWARVAGSDTFGIVTGRAVSTLAGDQNATLGFDPGLGDIEIEWTVASAGVAGSNLFFLCYANSSNWLQVRGGARIAQAVGGTISFPFPLDTSGDLQNGDVIKVQRRKSDNTIKLFRNGSQVGGTMNTDASLSATKIAVQSYQDNTFALDSISGKAI